MIATAICLQISGCSPQMSGKYEDSMGVFTLEFKAGKAFLTNSFGGTIEEDYSFSGNQIIIRGPQGNLVLTQNPDGSLSGLPMGDILKRVE